MVGSLLSLGVSSAPPFLSRQEEVSMAQAMPPWIQVLQQRDPKFVDAYMAQREHILRDGAIPAKYKHLMTMIVDALQTHPDGVATIANRARAAGASEAEIQEAVEITYLFGGTPALVTAMNAFRMIEPPSRSSGRAFCTVKSRPLTLVPNVVSKSSSEIAPSGASVPLPAFAKTTSMRPFSRFTVAYSRSRSARFDTSP